MANRKSQIGTVRSRWLEVLVFVCAVAPFLGALGHGYSRFDDVPMLEHEAFHGLGWEQLKWMFTTSHMGHYQPLAWLSFAIEWTVFGLDARVSHAINVLVHGVNAVLVLVLARRMIGLARPELGEGARGWGAVVAAVLFAVHPLRVESVAWVTERRDVLSLCFYLLAVIWYLKVREEGRHGVGGHRLDPKAGRVGGTGDVGTGDVGTGQVGGTVWVWVFFVLSLLAKAWGMTFFLVLLIVDWYPLRRLSGRWWETRAGWRVAVEKAPFAVVGVGWAVVAGAAASSLRGTSKTLAEWGIADRACQAVYGLMFYLWKTVWPTGLSVLYELPKRLRVNEPRVIAAVVVVGAAVVVCVAMRRKWPAMAAAMAAYAVIVSPVLGLFQSGIQLVADRYSYISMIAPMMVLGGAVAVWGSRRKQARVFAAVAVVVVAAGLAVLTVRQVNVWREDEVLFGHALASGQDGPVLRIYYGKQLDRVGRPEEAVGEFRKAVEFEPRNGEAWWAMGNSLKAVRKFGEAKEAYVRARGLMRDSWRADQSLGLLLAEDLDDLEGAVAYFRSAVEKVEGPENWIAQPGPYLTLAQALYDLGDVAGARRELEKALKFRETHEKARAALKKIGAGR